MRVYQSVPWANPGFAAARVEVHTGPQGRGRPSRYDAVVAYDAAAAVPLRLAGQVCGQVGFADLLWR